MIIKTSVTDPIRIAELAIANGGVLGVTFCPGKKDRSAGWNRDLDADLDAIEAWGANAVVTLIEAHEFSLLGVEELEDGLIRRAIAWYHFPITDVSTPDERFEAAWRRDAPQLVAMLRSGKRVVVHCRGGLGRAGTIAACMLIELGVPADAAIRNIRDVRPHAIETAAQEAFVRSYQPVLWRPR